MCFYKSSRVAKKTPLTPPEKRKDDYMYYLLKRIAEALESISNSLNEMNGSGVEVYLMDNSKDEYSRSYLESLSDTELITLAKEKGVWK